MKVQVLVAAVVVVVGVVSASPARLPHFNDHRATLPFTPSLGYRPDPYYNEIPSYNYQYDVSDGFGNNFGHGETRDGYNTKGEYFVNLPDGRLQKVSYVVSGDSGYQAQVSYVGEAHYPVHVPAGAAYGPGPLNPNPVYG